jgi:crotonobetainyl-CoA:carnitine CoA-transferase CaiB-like acyl-CoA transferase
MADTFLPTTATSAAWVDLRSPQGKEIFFELIVQGDVLIDNFRPSVLDRLGFAWNILQEKNPRLIQASITVFGTDGPYRDRPSYDALSQALSGALCQFIDAPRWADNVTGFFPAYGVRGAL